MMPPKPPEPSRPAGRRRRAVAWLLTLATAGALAAAWTQPRWRLPDRHNPWAPLTIDEPPGWLTRYKLSRLDGRAAACQAVLATASMQLDALPDRTGGAGCLIRNAVRVRATQLRIGEPLTLSCRAAVSLAMWERHAVLPEAERLFGVPLRRLEHVGSYACRNVYGREGGPRSQHASADALDVVGFVLADGRRIAVARDWRGDDAKARFLRGVHDGACRYFDGVLGPDYNREHADHFHLDRGPYRLCR